jgi:hypothetical protein
MNGKFSWHAPILLTVHGAVEYLEPNIEIQNFVFA